MKGNEMIRLLLFFIIIFCAKDSMAAAEQQNQQNQVQNTPVHPFQPAVQRCPIKRPCPTRHIRHRSN